MFKKFLAIFVKPVTEDDLLDQAITRSNKKGPKHCKHTTANCKRFH